MNSRVLRTMSGALELRAGDVVFTRIGGFLFGRVAEATQSWTSHVGVISHYAEGTWWVAESSVPRVKLTSLDAFIGRSEHGRYAIRRLPEGLSREQEQRLRTAINARLGVWYDLGFNYDSRRQYCSKFVHAVYTDALGLGPGRVERFAALLARQPSAGLTFWRWWFAGWIPMRRRTISPSSQYEDTRFVTVLEGDEDSPLIVGTATMAGSVGRLLRSRRRRGAPASRHRQPVQLS